MKAIATEASDDDPLTRIVAAARQLFADNGVSRTRLEDVSAAVGISRQYLYRFVSGRDGLIELALLARCRELGAQLEARAHLDADDVTAAVADQVVAGAMIAHDDEFVLLAEAMPRDRLNALLTGADSPLHRTQPDQLPVELIQHLAHAGIGVDAGEIDGTGGRVHS